MRTYIITGAGGLVGTNLLMALDNQNNNIVAIKHMETIRHHSPNIKEVECDVRDKETLNSIFSEYSNSEEKICIHCAGIITIKSKNDDMVYDVNVNGTNNVIEQCMKYGYRLIYISSVHVFKELPNRELMSETDDINPDNLSGIYAKTKAQATINVLSACKKGLQACIVHPSGIIGPYDFNCGNFTTLIKNYVEGKLPAIIKGGYDFVDVRDVVKGIIGAVEHGINGNCYLLTNKYYTIKELIEMLSEITGRKKIKMVIPTWIIKIISPLFESASARKGEKPLFTPYSIYVLNSNSNFSHDKATRDFDYKPRDMRETLKDTCEWLRNSGAKKNV